MIPLAVIPLLLATALAAGGDAPSGSTACLHEIPDRSGPMAQWKPPGAQLVPARGMLLVARPGMMDLNFAESVVLLLHHDESGSMGLIVNRRSRMTLTELFPDLDGLEGRTDPLYLGGPVNPDSMLLLIRSGERPADAVPIVDDVLVSNSPDWLEKLVSAESDVEFRAYGGYAGWGPSQLDRELDRGDWHVVRGSGARIFSKRTGDLWRALQPRNELELSRMLPRAESQ